MKRQAIVIWICYGLISAVGLHYHELFLDEAHHFLVSRDSATISELYYNLRFDGHPRLWGALLFFITHYISTDPTAMQVLQWVFAMAVAYVLLRFAPFPLWMKVLMLAGYYFLFEYDVLSRNYAIGIWMLFLCTHWLRDADRNAWRIGVLILLMCSAHVFFAIASIGIFVYLVEGWRQGKLRVRRLAVLTVAFALGLATSVIQARTPSVDNVNMTAVQPTEWLSGKNLSFAAGALVQGWLPVPQVNGGRFWNTGWLNAGHLGPVMSGVLFVGLLLFPAVLLRRNRAALWSFAVEVGLLLLFFDVTHMTANRYFGMVYIFFIAAAWLTVAESGTSPAPTGAGSLLSPEMVPGGRLVQRGWWLGWLCILVVQVLVGVYAFSQDIARPFSQSRNAAEYLRKLRSGGCRIVLDGYTAGPQLCAYLQCRLYCLTTRTESSFCVWSRSNFPLPRPAIGEEFAQDPSLHDGGEFILVSNRYLGTERAAGYRLTLLKSFENSIVGENYYIYQADPVPLPGASTGSNPAF